jgi:flagellar basal-body rod protein FlgF
MADGIYIGMSGAAARSEQLDAISDALANVSTPGFKTEHPAFASVLSEAGGQSYATVVGTAVDSRRGVTQQTGNPLDVVPQDGAWLKVQTASGDTAYTRDGRMTVSEDGQLRVAGGAILSAQGGPLYIPRDTNPQISSDGTVTANGEIVGRLGTFNLSGNLTRVGASLYSADDARPVAQGVQVGAIEMSNASALESAVGMVQAQRGFESSMQVIDVYKTMHDRANDLGKVR